MPTYDYQCTACKHAFELFQSMSAPVQRKCPKCGKNTLERLIGTGAAIVFKGSGFYQTDYRSEDYRKAAEADKPSEAKAEAKTDSKPDAKPETKSGTNAETKAQNKDQKSVQSRAEGHAEAKPAAVISAETKPGGKGRGGLPSSKGRTQRPSPTQAAKAVEKPASKKRR